MKKILYLGIIIIVIAAIFIYFFSDILKTGQSVKTIKPSYNQYVYFHTSGLISKKSTIRVQFTQDVIEQELTIGYDSAIPMFEFPFFDELGLSPSLIFGEKTTSTGIVAYHGGVKTGMDINLYFDGYVSDITIANSNGSQIMTLNLSSAENHFGSAVRDQDRVIINTRVGEKSAYFVRDNEWFNIINGIAMGDDWVEIRPGENTIVISAVEGEEVMLTDIQFNQLREGI